MKKKVITVLVMGCLLALAVLAKSTKREDPSVEPPATSISIKDLLQAHHILQNSNILSGFFAEAERTIWPSSKLPGSFKRQVTVARYGQAFRYQRADPQGLIKQFDLFDGNATYHVVKQRGKLVETTNQLGNSPSEAVGFEIKTFGLIPILQQLADPKTESVYLGRTAQGEDKLQIKTPTSNWTVYTDSEHLIRRVEARDNTIVYDDYHVVQGIWLPFSQRFSVKGKLYFELAFNRIDLKPTFASDYFSHEVFLKEIAR